MTKNRPYPRSRTPLTTKDFERLTVDDLARLKLTADEKARFREINKARDLDRIDRVARMRQEQVPLLTELKAVGLKINSVSDLINMRATYEQAIPVLLNHLVMPYSDVTKETIARALSIPLPAVHGAWQVLVREYSNAPIGWGIKGPGDSTEFRLGAKDGLACALSVAVTDETLPELIALAKDPANGDSRVLLLSALKVRRTNNPLAKQAIDELARDPALQREIAMWGKP